MTHKVTILEALAEKKLIVKKIESQNKFIVEHICRSKNLIDPLEAQGGSPLAVEQALQSIVDLSDNLVKITNAINLANQANSLTIEGQTATIAEWLIWKRDVADTYQTILSGMALTISQKRRQNADPRALQAGQAFAGESTIVHVNEVKLQQDIERIHTVRERLDGQLSLADATIMVEIP